jgi:hypothetical protein
MFSVRQALNPSISFGLTLASKDWSNNTVFVYSVYLEFNKKRHCKARLYNSTERTCSTHHFRRLNVWNAIYLQVLTCRAHKEAYMMYR